MYMQHGCVFFFLKSYMLLFLKEPQKYQLFVFQQNLGPPPPPPPPGNNNSKLNDVSTNFQVRVKSFWNIHCEA